MNLVSSEIIFKALSDRWKELDLNSSEIIKDATERGLKSLTHSGMSKYKKRTIKGAITEEQLYWLLTRYGIPFSWAIGVPKMEDGKLKHEIPPYNELECLKKIQEIYGK